MLNLFGRKKSSAPSSGGGGGGSGSGGGGGGGSTPQASLATIRSTVERLEKREEFLQKKIQNQTKVALQKKKAGDKNGAVMALKKKKLLEKEVDKLGNSRLNLESQIMAIESASVNVDTVSGMKAGQSALKEVHKKVNVESVEELKDDIQEQMDNVDEVNDVLGQPMAGQNAGDEQELWDELEGMEAGEADMSLDKELEDLEEEPAKKPAAKTKTTSKSTEEELPDFPEAPSAEPKVEESEDKADLEDDEAAALAELEASLST